MVKVNVSGLLDVITRQLVMAPKELVVRMCHFALKLEKFQMFGDSINTLLEIVLQHTGSYI